MEVRVLGLLEVTSGGRAVELRAAKLRAVLAMLALHPNEVVSAERLTEALWGESPPPSAANTLQVYVSQLRKALAGNRVNGSDGALIQTRAPGYVLAVDAEAVDARRFERLLAEGRAALAVGEAARAASVLDRALALWRGPALGDFTFESFAQADIARLEELRIEAVEEQMEAELALGRHDDVVGRLGALVEDHPLRERLWGQRMVALYRCGRQAEALRAYAELRRHLGEELGIEPSPALRALEEAVLLQRPDLDWLPPAGTGEVPHNLPAPRSSFVGRDQERAELDKMLAATRLVTVVGPGGIGKTRLAVEVARQVRSRFPDGVWLVELASLGEPTLVPQAVATALGVREEPGRSLTETLARTLGAKTMLIVLDNCEHLVGEAAVMADALLAAAADLAILTTSREPLRVEGENLWRAPSLAVPDDDLGPEALLDFDGTRLFVDRAAAQGGFVLTADNASAVGQLCRRLDGIPLAIELAAARTRVLSPAQIANRLDDRFTLLTGGARTALGRHQTLQAAVDWSYDLLSEPERTLFRRLSVFAGGFDLEAAEAVCAGDGLDRDSVLDLLSSLVDRSLVVIHSQDEQCRYSLLETLRDYAGRRTDPEERIVVRSQHLRWVESLADGFAGAVAVPLTGGNRPQSAPTGRERAWRARLRLEHDNLRQALEGAIASEPQTALRIVAVMGHFWGVASPREGRHWAEAALDAAPDAPLGVRTLALRRAGRLTQLAGDTAAARPFLERAAAGFRQLGDTANLLALLEFLAAGAAAEGDYPALRDFATECMALATEVGDDHLLAEATAHLGVAAMAQGDFVGAKPLLEQASEDLGRIGLTACRAEQIGNLGRWALLQGDCAEARPPLEEALRLAEASGSGLTVASCLGNLGELAFFDGDMQGGRSRYGEQFDLARKLKACAPEQDALHGLGLAALRSGDIHEARLLLKRCLRVPPRVPRARLPRYLETLAGATVEDDAGTAAALSGAADALRGAMGTPIPPVQRPFHELDVDRLRYALAPSAFAAAWDRGQCMSVGQAIALAAGE